MKYYIIAGEASGDLHGSNLMKALFEKDPQADIRFWGGDLMKEVGGVLVKHYKDSAFMGFIEVLQNIGVVFKNISMCKKDIEAFQPDAIIFIDYPGFNMRIAKWAKNKGFTTHYYISPKIWAWKENRIKGIKRYIDHMYIIFPFEKDFYEKKHNFPVHFVGNPLIDAINQYREGAKSGFRESNSLGDKPIIALLPGSRKQEISKILSEMLKIIPDYPEYQFVIAGAPSIESDFYKPFLGNKNVTLVFGETYGLLNEAFAALVTSGTATLETALFKVPQVVLYKGSQISYEIGKRLITLKYISLVNLIMDKKVVTELIQADCNHKLIKEEFVKIIGGDTRVEMLQDYDLLIDKLGEKEASKNTAMLIIQNS